MWTHYLNPAELYLIHVTFLKDTLESICLPSKNLLRMLSQEDYTFSHPFPPMLDEYVVPPFEIYSLASRKC